MKKSAQRIITIASLIVIVLLFSFFLRDVLVPLVRFQMANDVDGARALLTSKGVFGFLTVILVEALQMVVVFIPAEFIQISSGLSYPFPLALLLCDVGICLGATIIFILVRVFRFSSDAYEKKEAVIDQLAAQARKDRGVVLLLYFLFIMPIIPFGAICYYGSSRNLKYRKYILTVATGVIPSIVTSNLMGAATRYFLVNDLPLWVLLLVIVLLALLLFVILFLFLDKVYFKENDGTPDSPVYLALFKVVGFLCRRRANVVTDDALIRGHEGPYLLLSNHESFWDFYYIHRLIRDRHPAYVLNRFYFISPVLGWIGRKTGMIPKRLFTTDFETPVRIMRTMRKGYSVVVFPEGRLSLDGRDNPIVENSASFFRRLGVDIVLGNIRGAYFAGPKWRQHSYPSQVRVSAVRVLTQAEIQTMTDDELQALIAEALSFDESAVQQNTYPQANKAKGLENLLYRCADCGALYTTEGVGNDLVCRACGSVHSLLLTVADEIAVVVYLLVDYRQHGRRNSRFKFVPVHCHSVLNSSYTPQPIAAIRNTISSTHDTMSIAVSIALSFIVRLFSCNQSLDISCLALCHQTHFYEGHSYSELMNDLEYSLKEDVSLRGR